MYNQNNFEPYYEVRKQKPENNRPSWGVCLLIAVLAALLGSVLSTGLVSRLNSTPAPEVTPDPQIAELQ